MQEQVDGKHESKRGKYLRLGKTSNLACVFFVGLDIVRRGKWVFLVQP